MSNLLFFFKDKKVKVKNKYNIEKLRNNKKS